MANPSRLEIPGLEGEPAEGEKGDVEPEQKCIGHDDFRPRKLRLHHEQAAFPADSGDGHGVAGNAHEEHEGKRVERDGGE